MTGINAEKYAEIGRQMRGLPPEKSASSYEWEELVQKLCDSDDAGLHGIGVRELHELTYRDGADRK